jgi:hypothetical protein
MADLTGTTPANTYKGLLQVNAYTDGIAGNTGSSALAIQDGAGNATALAISTDNVGIGTTSPEEKLHIEAAVAPTVLIENTDSSASVGQSLGAIEFKGNDASTNADGIRAKINAEYRGVGGGTALILSTAAEGSAALEPRVYIQQDGDVGIGTTSPSAPLEVSSTTGGVIMPRMTTAQRNAIASPTNGEMVYDTDLNKFYGYANGVWIALH